MEVCKYCGKRNHLSHGCAMDDLRDRIKELEEELSKHQESQFHPDWSLLQAAEQSIREHRQAIRELDEENRLAKDYIVKLSSDITSCAALVEAAREAKHFFQNAITYSILSAVDESKAQYVLRLLTDALAALEEK